MPEIEIKDKPELRTFLRKVTELSFTGIVWGIWAYLFLPVLNIILWVLGIRYFQIKVIEEVGYLELLAMMNRLGWTILIVFLVLRIWGYYNYWRFGRRNRRNSVSPASIEQIARYYNIPSEELKQLISRKEITLP